AELALWTQRLLDHLRGQPALADVASNLQNAGLQAHIEIDRDAAARLGVKVSDIAAALHSAFGQRQISTLFTQSAQYRVVLEADDTSGRGLGALEGLYVMPAETAGGDAQARPVPLSAVARVGSRQAPLV